METVLDKWHQGCKRCEARNDFLIPHFAELIRARAANRIAFIGPKTGYIPATIYYKLQRDIEITLIDTDPTALHFFKTEYKNINATLIENDVIRYNGFQEYDIVFSCNLIIEILDIRRYTAHLFEHMRLGAILVCAMPDTLTDILPLTDAGPNLYSSPDTKTDAIDKVDKFTGSPYKFYPHRPFNVIQHHIESGFKLLNLGASETTPRMLIMVFQK